MGHDDLVIIGRVVGALIIGAMIGFERTFHGRPAGFRTHSLVCVASALLMIVTVYQNEWMTLVQHDANRPALFGDAPLLENGEEHVLLLGVVALVGKLLEEPGCPLREAFGERLPRFEACRGLFEQVEATLD